MTMPAMYQDAPRKIKAGRIVLFIGCILCFVSVVLHLGEFIYYLIPSENNPMNWTNPSLVFDCLKDPFLAVFYLLAGIGGICFIRDHHKMKEFCSLAGVIMLAVFVIGTVLMFRDLIKTSLTPGSNAGIIWGTFFGDLLGIQLSGGIYFIGWFMIKDYTGD